MSEGTFSQVAAHNVFLLQVVTEGRLVLEFTFDDLMRIRSWHFAVRQHRELIPRSVIAMQVGASEVIICFLLSLLQLLRIINVFHKKTTVCDSFILLLKQNTTF